MRSLGSKHIRCEHFILNHVNITGVPDKQHLRTAVLLSRAHTVPLFPKHTAASYRVTACADLILAAVSSLARATWKTNNNNNKKKKRKKNPTSVTADGWAGALFPSLRSLHSLWLGSGLESTQPELVHCNWMLRAGGNCSHLPTPDVWSPPSSDIVMRLWFAFPFSCLLPQRGCYLPVVTHSSNYPCLNWLPPPFSPSLSVHEWEMKREREREREEGVCLYSCSFTFKAQIRFLTSTRDQLLYKL